MGDEDNRDAARLQITKDPEKQLGLVCVETRGRLIQHQNPRIGFERAGDRNELLDRHRIRAERSLDVDVDVEPLQPLPGAATRIPP